MQGLLYWREFSCDFEVVMKAKSRRPEQDDLLRPRLVDLIDMRHELVKLSDLLDWRFFEEEWAGYFPSHCGRPAASPRLVAGLLFLQHSFNLSDEAVIARWVWKTPITNTSVVRHFSSMQIHLIRLP